MKNFSANHVLENVLTQDDRDQIYTHIAKAPDDQIRFIDEFSQVIWLNWLPDSVVDKLTAAAQATSDVPIELRELSFCRYAIVEGKGVVPLLFPHLDETFKEPRLTLDVQVESTLDWPIVIEGTEFSLEDNQALTFSGTHQVHWRKKVEFGKEDHVDMIFAHFSEVGVEKEVLTWEHFSPLIERRDQITVDYNNES
tara:strand:- start:1760 stop:2347 length:588 start_codon:yes stop_codon:yes gene_type:complete